jgi:hypothetical protein
VVLRPLLFTRAFCQVSPTQKTDATRPGRLERGARARGSGMAVQQLNRESGKGLFVGGVKLPLALAECSHITGRHTSSIGSYS